MQHKKPTLSSPAPYLAALERSNIYLNELDKNPHASKGKLLGAAALKYVALQERKSDYKDMTTCVINVIGTLPTFLDAQVKLDALREMGRPLQPHEKDSKKRSVKEVIPFNHALRELSDNFPAISPDQIVQFSQQTLLATEGKDAAVYAGHQVRRAIRGMRNEIGAEQIFWSVDGVEDVRSATEDEELEGIDLVVTYNGYEHYYDIKSSEKGEQDAWNNFSETSVSEPLYSGLKDSDFGDSFRISNATVAQHTDYYKDVLDHYRAHRQLAS